MGKTAVDDYGLEVLRKAAEDSTAGTKYNVRTKNIGIDANGDDVTFKGGAYHTAFSTDTPLAASGTFDSGIQDLNGFQFLSTQLYAGADGTLFGYWYDDTQTNILRTFSIPYDSDDETVTLATPLLGRYLRYNYVNNDSTGNTIFRLRLFVSNVPYHGQVLPVESFVPSNVLSQLTRSILVGKNPSGVYNNIETNATGALLTADFLFEVAQGNVTGYRTENKFGYNNDIGTMSTPEDIWAAGGVYTGQPAQTASAETVQVFSSSANDTSAGTGARTMLLIGLDENWAPQEVTVTMNGTTAVTTTEQWHRVFRGYVVTAGTTESNAGDITIRHSTTTANIFGHINAGDGETKVLAYTVPASKKITIVGFRVHISRSSGNPGSAEYELQIRENGNAWRAIRAETLTTGYPVDKTFQGGINLAARTDIRVRVESVSDNSTAVSGEFEFVEIDV